ncbi:hypothetical protein J2X31_000635 [Flavobacterium arsenatis]|uniref:Uncharacterized protein n=1 Tax=Flavobacterium arsenatis TaxID=1484332 RepID=A0ABU1TMI3_9FLAO|nr:hypothetical protein [Flavobacterium arsenatis]MDR6966637.1 hypothetical protein [Flavobacterium arsenatis]
MNNLTLTADQAKAMGQNISGSKSFGPLTLNYNIDLSIPQISASATLYGVSIGSVVINPNSPSATIGGNVGIAKAELTLTANFQSNELDYNVDVEAFGHTIYSGSGKLFSW